MRRAGRAMRALLALLALLATAAAALGVPAVWRTSSAARAPGDRVSLECRVEESAAPSTAAAAAELYFSWYRNGELLSRSATNLLIDGQFLQIPAAQPADNGVYSCSVHAPARAQYEESRVNFALDIYEYAHARAHRSAPAAAPAPIPAPAAAPALRFSPPPLDKKLELDATGRIHCKVVGGVAQPNVTWYKGEEEELPAGAASANGTLVFAPAQRRHGGDYTCRATDGVTALAATIAVRVVVSPRVLEPAAGAAVEATEGERVWLHCRAAGDPPPTTHWDRNLSALTPPEVGVETADGSVAGNDTRVVLLRNGTLLIRSARARDADRYGCTAGSAAGLARHELTLAVRPGGGGDGAEEEAGAAGGGSKAVAVSVAVAAAYMLLVLALMLYCRRRRARAARRGEKIEIEELDGGEAGGLMESAEPEGGAAKRGNGAAAAAAAPSRPHDAAGAAARSDNSEASRASRRSQQYEQLAVPRSLLADPVTLGRGEFGEVILAKVDVRRMRRAQAQAQVSGGAAGCAGEPGGAETDDSRLRPVLVKALSSCEESHLAEFRRELELFSRARHEGVARLLALCTDARPHYMLLEHTDWGELKQFLRATRSAGEAGEAAGGAAAETAAGAGAAPLTVAQAAALAAQLARAGRALAKQRLVHRDIAARNCAITSRLQLKLSLPALSRGPHHGDYYRRGDEVVPLRWAPAEAALEGDYSTKSDVYMFAATVWEIFHKAEQPFSALSDAAVLEALRGGSLRWAWSDAAAAPPALRALMERCWSASPAQRPQFEEVCAEMGDVLQALPAVAPAPAPAAAPAL